MWRKLMVGVFVFVLFTGAVILWSGESKHSTEHASAVVSHTAAEGRVAVKPDHRAVLAAEVAGRLDHVLVDNLSPVRKGQILAVLYNADLAQRIRETEELLKKSEAAYAEVTAGARQEDIREAMANAQRAEAALDLARSNEDRDRKLRDEGVIAQSRYDATASEFKQAGSNSDAARERYLRLSTGERPETVDAARAEMLSQKFALEALKAQYEKTLVRSPLDGIVIMRYRNTSEFADVGDPIVEVADISEVIVEGDVNEMDAGSVTKGQNVIVTADAYPGRQFAGEVYEVSESLKRRASDPEDPAVVIDQKVLPIKVRFLQPVPLKLGMKVDLKTLPGSPESGAVSSR